MLDHKQCCEIMVDGEYFRSATKTRCTDDSKYFVFDFSKRLIGFCEKHWPPFAKSKWFGEALSDDEVKIAEVLSS